jgi:hypothetical protein
MQGAMPAYGSGGRRHLWREAGDWVCAEESGADQRCSIEADQQRPPGRTGATTQRPPDAGSTRHREQPAYDEIRDLDPTEPSKAQ